MKYKADVAGQKDVEVYLVKDVERLFSAIDALYKGEWDNEDLESFGELFTDHKGSVRMMIETFKGQGTNE